LPSEKIHIDDLRSRLASVFKEIEEFSLKLQQKKAQYNAALSCETICTELSSLRDQLTDVDIATSKLLSNKDYIKKENISESYNHVIDSVYKELKENQVLYFFCK
jgi:hypothetical protein